MFAHKESTSVHFKAPSDEENVFREKTPVVEMDIKKMFIQATWNVIATVDECGLSHKKLTDGNTKDLKIGECGCAFFRDAFSKLEKESKDGSVECPHCKIPFKTKIIKKTIKLNKLKMSKTKAAQALNTNIDPFGQGMGMGSIANDDEDEITDEESD